MQTNISEHEQGNALGIYLQPICMQSHAYTHMWSFLSIYESANVCLYSYICVVYMCICECAGVCSNVSRQSKLVSLNPCMFVLLYGCLYGKNVSPSVMITQ